MSTLIACDYEGCKHQHAIEYPGIVQEVLDASGWVGLTVPRHWSNSRACYHLCPEHAALLSEAQWKDVT